MNANFHHGWRRWVNIPTVGSAVIALFVLLPLYWMLASSFKSQGNVSASPPQFFPIPIVTSSYNQAFSDGFGGFILNSFVVATCSTALVLMLGTLAGYALRARAPAHPGQVPRYGVPSHDLGVPDYRSGPLLVRGDA
jgi:multiple sugar transport system permease protein